MKLEQREIEDLVHQIRGPLFAAVAILNSVLDGGAVDARLERELYVVRGLCRKAGRVARNAGLLSELIYAERVNRVKLKSLRPDELEKMVIEAATDNAALISPERSIRIEVDRDSLRGVGALTADRELLEQAIQILLDNAVKYSYAGTVISVGGRRVNGAVSIAVDNEGIGIDPRDAPRCTERGWRGEKAGLVTGEGSGVGLWVAEQIMKAHGGEVRISPTDLLGRTLVQLVFPDGEESS